MALNVKIRHNMACLWQVASEKVVTNLVLLKLKQSENRKKSKYKKINIKKYVEKKV